MGSVISSVGYLFGKHWEALVDLVQDANIVIAGVALVVAAFFWWRWRRNAEIEDKQIVGVFGAVPSVLSGKSALRFSRYLHHRLTSQIDWNAFISNANLKIAKPVHA